MYGAGAVSGFFAVPYTILVYPIIFVFMPRMWSVSHRRGYVTTGRLRPRPLRQQAAGPAVALTGILATMPYIALQLVGIQAVLDTMGLGGSGGLVRHGPAADHRLRRAGRLHVLLRPAGAGDHRVRQGHADLHRDRRRGHLRRGQDRLSATCSTPPRPSRSAEGQGRRIPVHPDDTTYWAYGSLALGLGHGAVHVPALDDGRRSQQEPQRHPAQRLDPADLLADARRCWRCSVSWPSTRRPAAIGQDGKPNAQLVGAAPVPATSSRAGSPVWRSPPSRSARWCRRRSCRSPRPTCSPATSTSSTSQRDATPQAGGAGRQDRVAGGEVRRADLRAGAGQAERDQLPAAGRGVDPADVPGHRRRSLHAMVPPLGAAAGLGRRHGLRHGDGLPPVLADDQALRQSAGVLPVHRHQGVHRDHRVRASTWWSSVVFSAILRRGQGASTGSDQTEPGGLLRRRVDAESTARTRSDASRLPRPRPDAGLHSARYSTRGSRS